MASFDEVIALAEALAKQPVMPERNKKLWQKAIKQAKEKLDSEISIKQSQFIARVPTTKKQPSLHIHSTMESAVEARAENIYRRLDVKYAEAVKKNATALDHTISELDLALTPYRDFIRENNPSACALLLEGNLPATDYKTRIGWMLEQKTWQAMWRQNADRIVHELKKLRSALGEQRKEQKKTQSQRPISTANLAEAADNAGIGRAIHDAYSAELEKITGWFRAGTLKSNYDAKTRRKWLQAMTGVLVESNGKPGAKCQYRKIP